MKQVLNAGFFDSATAEMTEDGVYRGDKAQNAAFMAELFRGMVDNGIGNGEKEFSVSVGSGEYSFGGGTVYINGYRGYTKWKYSKIDQFPGSMMYFILQLDTVNGTIQKVVATDPEVVPIREEGGIWQLVVARVQLSGGSILVDTLEDLRDDPEWCGRVKSDADIAALKKYVDDLAGEITRNKGVNEVAMREILVTAIDPGVAAANDNEGAVIAVYG